MFKQLPVIAAAFVIFSQGMYMAAWQKKVEVYDEIHRQLGECDREAKIDLGPGVSCEVMVIAIPHE